MNLPETQPPITRIIAIRHGETDWNADGRLQGQLDIELNATGLAQADQLAAALSHVPANAIYSSDLTRALQTAQPLGRAWGLPVQLEPGLRERHFGYYQGKTFAQVREMSPQDAQRWQARAPDFIPGQNGESIRVFSARVLETIIGLARRHPHQDIAVVAHGGVLDALYRAATHQALQTPRTWALGNASVSRLLWTPEGGLHLVHWADTSHLAGIPLAPHGEPADLEPLQPCERPGTGN